MSRITWQVLGLLIVSSISTDALAVSANIANQCRQQATKAFPPKSIGSKSGNAAAERRYFQECIANNGVMPKNDTKEKQPAPPPEKN